MKTEMSEDGVITIRPESSVEAYALRKFVEGAMVNFDDSMRAENCYWRGSKICVNANWHGTSDWMQEQKS